MSAESALEPTVSETESQLQLGRLTNSIMFNFKTIDIFEQQTAPIMFLSLSEILNAVNKRQQIIR